MDTSDPNLHQFSNLGILTFSEAHPAPCAHQTYLIISHHISSYLIISHHMAMAQNYQPPKWMVFLLNMTIPVGHLVP